ncbi:MAG: hypothetical protein ACFCU3_10475 [Verrucomicrobiales bacterium]
MRSTYPFPLKSTGAGISCSRPSP